MGSGLVEFFHGVQVAVMLALMLNIVQFAWWSVKRDKTPKSHCERFLPVYIVLFSTVLIMVQPVSMLVIGSWASIDNCFFDGADFRAPCVVNSDCGSGMCLSTAFNCTGTPVPGIPGAVIDGSCTQLDADGVDCTIVGIDCSCGMDSNALVPNTTIGWVIQIGCTYFGFIVMFIGVFMATKLHKKIARKWHALRAPSVRRHGYSKAEYPRAQPAKKSST